MLNKRGQTNPAEPLNHKASSHSPTATCCCSRRRCCKNKSAAATPAAAVFGYSLLPKGAARLASAVLGPPKQDCLNSLERVEFLPPAAQIAAYPRKHFQCADGLCIMN